MTEKRHGPARTGTLETCEDAKGRTYYRGKVRLQDGSLHRVEVDEEFMYSKKLARQCVGGAQAGEDETHAIDLAKVAKKTKAAATIAGAAGETCDAWYQRYRLYQIEVGHTDVVTKASRWKKWISPRIGPKPIAFVTRDDVEDVRDALDAAVHAWTRDGRAEDRISGKTAMNVWSCLTSAFKAASSSKSRDLRVLVGKPNPCIAVEPPGDKDSRKARRKPFVYPKECAELLACETVPLEWREIHAVAAYTYLRPGELRVLTWGDVDLAAGLIHVTKAWNYSEEIDKAPKTRNGVRRIPIEPTLSPLLKRMREGSKATDLVVPAMSSVPDNSLAEIFREHLTTAEVKRTELHDATRTHAQSNFRSWRDSGLTWLAMSGLGVDKIMRRAGHDVVQTTMGYVKQAEDLSGGELGEPFAALPPNLLAPTVVHPAVHLAAMSVKELRRARDSNPW